MRTKPDVSDFAQAPRDPSAFLDGAGADFPPPPAAPGPRTVLVELVKPEPTVQKLFRLRWDVASALKVGAAQESAANGRRVTETEIVERLLRQHYGLDI
jgi:hypothetical protein